MGMLGTIGREALNQVGIMLTGQDFEKRMLQQKMMRAKMDMLGQIPGLFGGQYATGPAPSVNAPPPIAPSAPAPQGGGAPAAPPVPMPSMPSLSDLSGAVGQATTGMASAAAPTPNAVPQPYQYQMPHRLPGASLSNSGTQGALALMTAFGLPGDKIADIMAKGQPDATQGNDGIIYDKHTGQQINRLPSHQVVNGYNVDLGAPNAPSFIPKLPDGTMPDGKGGVINIPGLATAMGAQAQATTSGQEAGKLPYAGPIAEATSGGTEAGKAPFVLGTHDVNGVPTTMTTEQALALAGATPRGLRNNNPGNLRPLSTGQWSGQSGVDGGNYAQFASPQAGAAAADQNLLAKQTRHGFKTLNQIIADPKAGWDPGNTGYAATVAQMVGVRPDQPIDLSDPDLRQKVLRAIFQVETGRQQPAPAAPGFHGANADDQKTVAGYLDAAKTAETAAALGHQFMALNKHTATGMGYSPLEVPIPFSHGGDVNLNLPGALAAKLHNDIPAMDNLSMQLALTQRAPGQRMTQFEIQKNLQTVPNKEHFGNQNGTVVAGYDTLAAQRRDYATFASNWLAQHGSLTGMEQAYAARKSPSQGSRGASSKVRTYNPKTGNLE